MVYEAGLKPAGRKPLRVRIPLALPFNFSSHGDNIVFWLGLALALSMLGLVGLGIKLLT